MMQRAHDERDSAAFDWLSGFGLGLALAMAGAAGGVIGGAVTGAVLLCLGQVM